MTDDDVYKILFGDDDFNDDDNDSFTEGELGDLEEDLLDNDLFDFEQ